MTLYLLPAERKLFDRLPQAVKTQWTVEEEKGTAWESMEELEQRRETIQDVRGQKFVSEMKNFLEQVSAKGTLPLENISEDAVSALLFIIGARGITALLEEFLKNPQEAEWEAVGALSRVRHQILQQNALLIA